MGKIALIPVLLIAAVATGGSAAGVEQAPAPAHVPRGISLRVPAGWHVIRGWLSDVTGPAPVLAVGSFDVRLSRRTCECGMPNVVDFPRGGAFLFIWEYVNYPRRALARIPRRPAHFRIPSGVGQRHTCQGPSDGFSFRDGTRVFQVEIYLGVAAGLPVRAQLRDLMDSLRFSRP
jgi:hypothetical protein